MVEDKIETILEANALQGLPVASESNLFPVIPETDSFLLVPKNNDSGDCVVTDDDQHRSLEGNVDGAKTTSKNGTGHVRRFSTGNITIPYTKVKILSRYLAASTGSCHDYCKYGARKEGEEEEEQDDDDHHRHEEPHNNNNNNNTSTLKRFHDTLGKAGNGKGHHHHHDDMFKQAAATVMERRNKMAISHVKTTSAAAAAFSTCFGSSPKLDSPLSAASRRDVTSNKRGAGGSTVVSEVGVSPKPRRRLDHHSFANKNTTTTTSPRLLLGSSSSASTSELGVIIGSSPKPYAKMKRDVSPSPLMKSRSALSKLGTPSSSSSTNYPESKPQKPRRSVSVSKVETSSSSSATNKLPILSKVFSSSKSWVEVGSTVPSSRNNYPKPQRVEAFVSPFHRRGASMSKLPLPSLNHVGTQLRVESQPRKSQLPKSKQDQRDLQRGKKLEAIPSGGSGSGSGSGSSNHDKTNKGQGSKTETVIPSPAKHKFLRRQSISEPLDTSPPAKNLKRLNRGKATSSHSKEDHQPANNNSNTNKVDDQPKNIEQVDQDQISTSVVNNNIDVEAAATATTHKRIANNNITQSSSRKMLKRAQNHDLGSSSNSPLLIHDKYKILRRSRPRSVISEPMAESKDCQSVISSTESCQTDFVQEQKAMERVLASRTANTTTTTARHTTRRGRDHNNNKDEQPRKLNFRPGRVIEFKPEISSPRRLKFRRRALRNDSSWSKVEVNFGVLRKSGGRREGGSSNRRVEFADAAEKVVLRHQDMKGERVVSQSSSLNSVIEETASKLVEDRKSKVKALVGAFESLIVLQDSKPITV